jgi:glutamate receptor, ionotropic, invertebrate
MEPEIESAFYFDLALRTFLAVKSILQLGSWPPQMKYLSCDEYDGTNTPDHVIDLRSTFVEVGFTISYACAKKIK